MIGPMVEGGATSGHRVRSRNYRLVAIDSVCVGVVSAAGTFLPVFLVRLGASGSEVGLLSSIPALVAVILAIPAGRWLQGRRNIVSIYGRVRATGWLGFAAMGVVGAVLPAPFAIQVMLLIWAGASIASTVGVVAFPIVMDGAAGPNGRFDLLGRRWMIAGLVMAVTVAIAGQVLRLLPFPGNFTLILSAFSVAGIGSALVSRQLVIPDQPPVARPPLTRPIEQVRGLLELVRAQPSFARFELRSVVYTASLGLAMPLLPLFYVREVGAPDEWIGIIGSAQSAGAVTGYLIAWHFSRRRGGMAILLPAMLAAAAVPAVMSGATWLPIVAALAFTAGASAAGTQLALFDQLVGRMPREHGVTFSSVDQAIQNIALIVAPSVGGLLAVAMGIRPSLLVVTIVGMSAAALFALDRRRTVLGTGTGKVAR